MAPAKKQVTPQKKASAPSKAVAKAPNKNLVREQLDGDDALFAAQGNAGLENVTARDILVPRISILQGLSPQLIKSKPEYNPDAKVGDIYDVGLGERMGDEILFLPILYKMVWLEWYPRATQKGLARIHETNDILNETTLDDKNRPIMPNGNYIAETAQFYGFNLSAGNRLSFIPMTSTQLKKARQWLTLASGEKLPDGITTPPLYYRAYRLSTVPESNAEGDWVGWKVERGPATRELEDWIDNFFKPAVESHKQLTSGLIRGDMRGVGDDLSGSDGAM